MINNTIYYHLFKQDYPQKQLHIAFDDYDITNEYIYAESMTITESLCSESELKLGACESGMFEIQIADSFPNMIGKKINVHLTADGNEPFNIGKYKVISDKPTPNKDYRKITAYDALYDVLGTNYIGWYNKILPDENTTITLKQFRDSFFSEIGITQIEVNLPNDDMIVQKTIYTDELSGSDILKSICEINGCFGNIDRDGNFRYVWLEKTSLYPDTTLYPSKSLFPGAKAGETYIDCQYENYKTQQITQVRVVQSDDDNGQIYGEDGNCYTISDNILLYGKGSEELNGIIEHMIDKVTSITYVPMSTKLVGNLCTEVGDYYTVHTKHGYMGTYAIQRTLSGIQAMRDVFVSEGEETYTDDLNSTSRNFAKIKTVTSKLQVDNDNIKLEVGEIQKSGSEAFQTFKSAYNDEIEAINNQVDKKADVYYQESDPSTNWDKDVKSEHIGDLWFNTTSGYTGTNPVIYGSTTDKTGQITYFWKSTDGVDSETRQKIQYAADTVDGKSSIYVEKPTSYEERDLLIPNETFFVSYNSTTYTFTKGKVYKTSNSNTSFVPTDWTEIEYFGDASEVVSAINISEDEIQIQANKVKISNSSDTSLEDVFSIENNIVTMRGGLDIQTISETDDIIKMSKETDSDWGSVDSYESAMSPNAFVAHCGLVRNTEDSTATLSGEALKISTSYFEGTPYVALLDCEGLQTSSDKRLKNSFSDIDISKIFTYLKPYSYKLNGLDKKHYGFIAQDVEEVFGNSGIDTDNLALLSKPKTNEDYYSLNYTEFIPILWKICQEQQTKIEELEKRLGVLENGI